MDHEAFWQIRVDNYRDHDYSGEYKLESDIFAMGCTALEVCHFFCICRAGSIVLIFLFSRQIYTGTPPAPLTIPYPIIKSLVDLIDIKREPVSREQELIPHRVLGAILTMIDYVPGHRPHSANALRWFTKPETIRITTAPPVFAKSTMRRLVNSPNFP